jgi:hypothetical protein
MHIYKTEGVQVRKINVDGNHSYQSDKERYFSVKEFLPFPPPIPWHQQPWKHRQVTQYD